MTSDLTTDVLTLADEVSEYFGGDYEGYTQIALTLELIEKRFRESGIKDGTYTGKLVLLTPVQLDALLAALAGFSPHPCTEDHGTWDGDEDNEDHGDESKCFGYGPKTLQALAEAETAISKAARS